MPRSYRTPRTFERGGELGTRERPIPHDGRLISTHVRSVYVPATDGKRRTTTSYNWKQILSHLDGWQITVSENHPEWNDRRNLKRPFQNIGGPFYTEKRFVQFIGCSTHFSRTVQDGLGHEDRESYNGLLLPCAPSELEWPSPLVSSEDDLKEAGTTAIARCSPSNPVIDVTTFLGELVKEGFPKLIGSGLRGLSEMSPSKRRKTLAKEHLNYEFGWKPFVHDLQDIAKDITHGDAVWSQYERDAGRLVRRRYEFPVEESFVSTQIGASGRSPFYLPSSGFLIDDKPSTGVVSRGDRVTTRRWFSGAFTYYLPDEDGETVAYNVIQAKKLLGIRLTPDAVWNLTPWSWATDWFANTGDILTNWSNWAIDGQILWYGYLMEHKTIERTYTYSGRSGLPGRARPGVVRLSIETKRRIPAGPYGFGSQFDGLSNRQIAIVTSLGVIRSK